MAHRFLIKEIALQAGLGVATVDRVMHGRANVREHTRKRVEQAIKELEKQELNLATTGRKLVVDVVVEAPTRFSDEIKIALDAELRNTASCSSSSTLSVAGDNDDFRSRGGTSVLLPEEEAMVFS